MKKLTLLAAAPLCYDAGQCPATRALLRLAQVHPSSHARWRPRNRLLTSGLVRWNFPARQNQIQLDGQEFGWRNQEQGSSEVSANQLSENGETEVAGEGRTNADFESVLLQAWDDEALYYLAEISDNIRDTEGWW